MDQLMADLALNETERGVQQSFRKFSIYSMLLIVAAVIGAHVGFLKMPDRTSLSDNVLPLEFVPVNLSAAGPLRFVGAWELRADDPRFDGLSALVVDGDAFLSISDSGVVVRFPKPGAANPRVTLSELPSGPGRVDKKSGNDSEALARDPAGRGWWVAFESIHQLRLFDQNFRKTLAVRPLDGSRWRENGGIEGLAAQGQSLALVAEDGDLVSRFDARGISPLPSMTEPGRMSDAAALPDGRILLLQRTLSPLGFSNAVAVYDPANGQTERLAALPLKHLDNAEGVTVEPLADGRLRIWVITDRDSRAQGRTLLAAYDWSGPNAKRPARRPGAR